MFASVHVAPNGDSGFAFAVHALPESGAPIRLVFDCVDLAHAQALQDALREVCAFEVR